MASKNYWMGTSCDDLADKQACLSWFGQTIPEDWGLPLEAEILEDPKTGNTKQLRALFRLPDGRLKRATRRFNKRSYVITLGDAKPPVSAEKNAA